MSRHYGIRDSTAVQSTHHSGTELASSPEGRESEEGRSIAVAWLAGTTTPASYVSYGLRTADAAHLATAVAAGAERFLTNHRKDFPQTITEIDIVYPDELPIAPTER